jgi:hypothetical protein
MVNQDYFFLWVLIGSLCMYHLIHWGNGYTWRH